MNEPSQGRDGHANRSTGGRHTAGTALHSHAPYLGTIASSTAATLPIGTHAKPAEDETYKATAMPTPRLNQIGD